jgi:hypothetical protein
VLRLGTLGGLAVQEAAGNERVLARGGMGQAEHQGQVQRVRPRGQRFMEHPVAADALNADAVPLKVPVEVAPADVRGAEGGLPGDQDVPGWGYAARWRGGSPASVRPAELMHAYIMLSLLAGIRTEEARAPRWAMSTWTATRPRGPRYRRM